jgi:hypothetical protein
VYLSKIDIADGFYRIWVRAKDVPKLGVLFPSTDGEEYLIGFPLALPMDWTESPKIFTAATETVADLANNSLAAGTTFGPHPLEVLSEAPPPPVEATPAPAAAAPPLSLIARPPSLPRGSLPKGTVHYSTPLALWDVYVDEFLGMVQGGTRTRRRVNRALLHTLDTVLRPLDSADSTHRQEPASTKKMAKGDALWATSKVILGWMIDTLEKTISLPAHRLASIGPSQRRVSLKKWQQVLGELWSMTLTIPAAIGLFSALQEALKTNDGNRVRLNLHAHAFLQDFHWLVEDVGSCPTAIDELVPDGIPSTQGACDASKKGLGGVHFVPLPNGDIKPLLWRQAWPASVAAKLVSTDTPRVSVTNSDLELAATIAQFDVLAQTFDVRSHTVHNLSDNAATIAWQKKGAASTSGPIAYLLRLHALHQCHHRYIPLHDFIPGVANVLSDQCSHHFHLTDAELLAHFNSSFPQTMPWQMCQLQKETLSALILALSRKRPVLGSLLNVPKQWMCIGAIGKISAWRTTSTLSSRTATTPSPSSKFLHNGIEMAARLPCKTPSDLEQWKTPSVRWVSCSPNWGPLTSGKMPSAKLTSASRVSFAATARKTPPPV